MAFKLLASIVALAAVVSGAHIKRTTCPDGSTVSNAACCNFVALKNDLMENLFDEGCNEEVHETLRLAFHDAISISPALTKQGKFGGTGADGSVIIFPNVEPNYPANLGINDSVAFLTPFFNKHNVTAGDLIQFANAVGLTTCPGAPRIKFLAGRPNAKQPAPEGLIPVPNDSITTILARFADAGGFTSDEVVALLASHSIARADHVDPKLSAAPFDSTPFTFDTQFFVETQLRGIGFPEGGSGGNVGEAESPLPQSNGENVGELRLLSDSNFARDSRTACTFQGFANNQNAMATKFAAAFAKLAVLGNDASSMVDCSEVLPPIAPAVTKPATFPAGKSNKDIEQACASTPFPTLATDPGAVTDIPHCPPGQTECDGS